MEGQSSAGNSQYQYQWQRLVRRNTLAEAAPPTSSLGGSAQLPTQLDLLPILLPQHSSYHQAQLAQYNRLITSSSSSSRPSATRLQSSPLPPLLSAQHIQALPGSRSSSPGGTTARTNKASTRGGHGNKETRRFSKGERALVTETEVAATMPMKKQDLSSQIPERPLPQHQNSTLSHQSSSVPSTPHQHARKFSFESREPSPNATNNHSPRSAYSESNIVLPSRPPPLPRGGCRYETALAHTKRRMPYSLGGEKLDKLNNPDIKSKLSEDEERKLSTDMRELYDRLLPTSQSEVRRERLVQKLEKLFNNEWPGHDIRVHVFGSSGNLLCTDESDVDICITTNWKELEGVCMIAELLAKHGMKDVICVSTAKVPIVKIWDPELKLACDMNVNNTLALENTRMIKTYVEIDARVRQLAMIVKHWTKRRILNDAAFGGTLSSYTWICMIINFLQTRNPPILPSLHQRQHLKLPSKDGVESSFADDLNALKNFGSKNKETLGQLLFYFFRFYGHEFDYEKLAVSVRLGKHISKIEKGWHITNNNRLCVEEPFNIGRNLGNTADDISFRGLHMELRRAFDLISNVKLDECCHQYEYPKVEERIWEKPPPKPKPVMRSASQSTRGGRGGNRGNRNNNQHGRSSNSSRRASSANYDNSPAYPSAGIPPNMSMQEAWLHRQAQAQLHNDLYATYSVLQAQENSLRLQLYNQSQQNLQAQYQMYSQSQGQVPGNGTTNKTQTDRNRTKSFDQPPLSAPIRPDMYFYPLQYQTTPVHGFQTPSTNPSSPSLSNAVPELRRSMHRSSVTNGSNNGSQSNSGLRSHSQPGTRSVPLSLNLQAPGIPGPGLGIYQPLRQANGIPIPNFIADESTDLSYDATHLGPASVPSEDNAPKEYVGYYVNDSAPSPPKRQSLVPMAIPSFGDVQQSRRRLSTDQLPQSILDRLKRPSRSPSPLGHDRSGSIGSQPLPTNTPLTARQSISSSNLRALNTQTPAVVNGSSVPAPISIPQWQAAMVEGSVSDYNTGETDSGSVNSSSQFSAVASDLSREDDISGQMTPRESRPASRVDPPMVVNGSSPSKGDVSPMVLPSSLSNGAEPQLPNLQNGLVPAEQANGPNRLSPKTHNRLARQMQNGGMSPLDISLSQNEMPREDFPHLSPVYETRTPSPTVNRKFDTGIERKANGSSKLGDEKPVSDKVALKSTTSQGAQGLTPSKPNGHTRGSKSEGGGANSWQKIPTKGKKKGNVSDTKGAGAGLFLSEKPPNNDAERRGG